MKENANTNQKIEFNKARKNLQDTYINEQTKYLQKQIDDIKTAADNKKSAIAWQIVNNITGRKTTNRSKIKAKDDKERIQKWKQHFSLLLGKNPITTNQDIVNIVDKELQIEQGPFTIKELEMVLRKTKKNKTAGLDEIPAEVWKTGHFNHILLEFCNDVYSQKPIEYWTKGCILPFPKKGDLTVQTIIEVLH